MTTTDDPTETEEKPWHLSGNNAPVFDEVTLTDLEVKGAIPPELEGRYVRNGANPQTGESAHWFLGDGMVHGIELSGGKANWYRNRYVRTPLMEQGGDTLEETHDLAMSLANTHIIGHAGRILALEELHWPWEMTPGLETVGDQPVAKGAYRSAPVIITAVQPERLVLISLVTPEVNDPLDAQLVQAGEHNLNAKVSVTSRRFNL